MSDERTFDLDAKRRERAAARAEAEETPVRIRVNGDVYDLPVELPLEVLDALGRLQNDDAAALKPALAALVGPDAWAAMDDGTLTINDAADVLAGIAKEYGVDLGNLLASAPSSTSTSTRSRPTSSGTTGSTSGRSVGARKRSARAAS